MFLWEGRHPALVQHMLNFASYGDRADKVAEARRYLLSEPLVWEEKHDLES